MNISTGTIIRTVVLIVALINQVLTMTGHSVLPFDEQQITDGLSMLFTAAAANSRLSQRAEKRSGRALL